MVVWLAMTGKYEKGKAPESDIAATLTQPAARENGRK
jgi:hypothetical protein